MKHARAFGFHQTPAVGIALSVLVYPPPSSLRPPLTFSCWANEPVINLDSVVASPFDRKAALPALTDVPINRDCVPLAVDAHSAWVHG